MSVCDVFDPDMLCFLCLQLAVDYRGLVVTGRRRVKQAGDELYGLCHSEGRLYVVERREESDTYSWSLTVHSVQSDSGHITRLDTLTGLWESDWLLSLRPRVDRHSRRVFVPCLGSGVIVARLDGVCAGGAAGGGRHIHLQPHCAHCPVRQRTHHTAGHIDRVGGGSLAVSVPPHGPSQPPGVRSLL